MKSCIKQFWVTAKAKTVNEEYQIQALVDKKKVIITKKSVRSYLMLEDAERTKWSAYMMLFLKDDTHGVLDLEEAKTAQAKEIASLKKRVKQLEKRRKSRTSGLKMLKKGRKIVDLDADAEVTLIDIRAQDKESPLDEFKAAKLKAVTTAATTITTDVASHKTNDGATTELSFMGFNQGKGKMVKPEKPMKKKDQIALDEELALKLHAKEQAELERM
ncbi:hypothetical protein Tco_1125745 [Tanacetum coccineum]